MRLIISTDGLAKPQYHDMSSVDDVEVPTADRIDYGYTVWNNPTHKREYIYLELTYEQAERLLEELQAKLEKEVSSSV